MADNLTMLRSVVEASSIADYMMDRGAFGADASHASTSLESELRICRSVIAQTEQMARLGTWSLDLESKALTWSQGAYRIFEVAPDTPITVDRALGFYPEQERLRLDAIVTEAAITGEAYDVTLPVVTARGRPAWVRSVGQVQTGGNGRRGLFGVAMDVTAERAAETQMRDLAYRDSVTGLANRRALLEYLEDLATGGPAAPPFVLILIDVDHFKAVNDFRGHAVGDEVLIEAARRIRSGARPCDMVARLGGDEFAVVLPGTDEHSVAERRGEAILALFDKPMLVGGGPLQVSLSMGAAVSPAAGHDSESLLRNADVALYRAKALGRARICVFHSDMGEKVEQRVRELTDLRRGLEHTELEVFYQPIVDLKTRAVRGLEALVRWNHPERGLLAPGAFEAGLTDPVMSLDIGDFVLTQGLRQMREWIDAGVPVNCLNFNVTESHLRRYDLVEQIMTRLEEARLEPSRLKLEILEGALFGRNPEEIARKLGALQSRGVMVALDDFGTGYASLTQLKTFKVDRLKIDRSFLEDICKDASNYAITHAIIDLGKNLGIRVTAEGIETQEQLALLLKSGCACGQGYLFSRPMPASLVAGFLESWYASLAAEIFCTVEPMQQAGAS